VPDRMGRKLEGGEEVFFELVITVAIAAKQIGSLRLALGRTVAPRASFAMRHHWITIDERWT